MLDNNIHSISPMSYLFKNLKKIIAIGIIVIMVFVLFSIITYDHHDPSALKALNVLKINNICGKYGANIADILVQTFGYSVILPIIFFLIFAIKILNKLPNKSFLFRVFGMLFGTILLSLTLSLVIRSNILDNIGYGGITGDYLKQLLLGYIELNILVSFLIIIVIFNIILCLGLSYKEWIMIRSYCLESLQMIVKCINFILIQLSNQKNKFKIADYSSKNIIPDKNMQNKQNIFKMKCNQLNELPSVEILNKHPQSSDLKSLFNQKESKEISKDLHKVLKDYRVKGKITNYSIGPVVTLFELELATGIKASKVVGLSNDIARSMSALSIRISVIPGKNTLGIEIPNDKKEVIYLRELIESKEYKNHNNKLPLVLGKSISGTPVVTDLSQMPHLLVAGTTGSGKSVAINTMILSLLYSCTLKQCRFVMIDPKMLELSVYNGIPHALSPVVTEAKKAVNSLKWVVQEMERRYRAMASLGVRNITGFNNLLLEASKKCTTLKKVVQTGFDHRTGYPKFEEVDLGNEELPYIVVIIDEIADLMLVSGKEIEGYIQRIAQMARASGIHLIMATQRPSVDVITGVIKANFPTRISFNVTSKIDSRTILGEQGAEQLLGMGDMLYMMPGGNITRVHGPFVSDNEVANVVKQLKKNKHKNNDVLFEGESSTNLV